MILITAGTGFIGKYFVKELIEKDYELRLLVRHKESAKEFQSNVEIFEGDATKLETLKGISKDIETVVHMVGAISLDPKENVLVNKVATQNIVDSCKEVEKIIYTSSADVFGPIKGIADENYPCKPNNPYGLSKLQAEQIILDSNIPSVILRPTIVYGIGSPWWKFGMKWLKLGFVPNTKNLTQLVHVKDVSNILSLSLKKGKGIYIVADEEPIKIEDLFSKVVQLLGKTPRKIPTWLVKLASIFMRKKQYFDVALANRVFSVEKVKNELGVSPTRNFEFELKEMVNWYKNLQDGDAGI